MPLSILGKIKRLASVTPPAADYQTEAALSAGSVTRREFLELSSATAIAHTMLARRLEFIASESTPVGLVEDPGSSASGRIRLLRHWDMLDLQFEFKNRRLRKGRSRNLFQLLAGHKPFPPVYESIDDNKPSFVVVHFPPQHIAEKAVYELADEKTDRLPLDPVEAVFSRPSRLAFILPAHAPAFDATMGGLLDWTLFAPSLVPTALPRGESTSEVIAEPGDHETAIELPARLVLSPNSFSAWIHSAMPVRVRDDAAMIDWIELWHTRLSTRLPGQDIVSETNDYFRTVRAVFAREDEILPPGTKTFVAPPLCSTTDTDINTPVDAMSRRDRFEIVQLSANFNDLRAGEATASGRPSSTQVAAGATAPHDVIDPQPIAVENLMLTSQGGWLLSQGDWEPADLATACNANESEGCLGIRQWKQDTTGGRDTLTSITYGGFLYPYGHRATLTKVTERRFQRKNRDSPFKAYQRQRTFITLEQAVMAYGDAGYLGDESIDRQMPFVTIVCTTPKTPSLDPRSVAIDSDLPTEHCNFWPSVLGKKFLFQFKGIDAANQTAEFLSPVIFFDYRLRYRNELIEEAKAAFAKEQKRSFAGQKVAFTPEEEPGDATLEAESVYFSAYSAPEAPIPAPPAPVVASLAGTSSHSYGPSDASASDETTSWIFGETDAPQQDTGVCCSDKPPRKKPRAPWKTHVPRADVKSPALKGMGTPDFSSQPLALTWDQDYLKHGFGVGNLGHLFANVNGPSFSLPDTHAVGLFKPDFDLKGFSRKFGAVGNDLPNLKLGQFDPTQYFKFGPAKFLGAIDLGKLLQRNLNFTATDAQIVPPFKSRIIRDSAGIPIRLENYLDWQPKLKDQYPKTEDGAETDFVTINAENATASVKVLVATQAKGGQTTHTVSAEILNISVTIASAIRIDLHRISFGSENGQGLAVHVEPGGVAFLGGLAFLAEIQKKFGESLFGGSGPRISFEDGAVVARATFGVPSFAIGAFSLEHLSLSPSLRLPILGDKALSVGVDLATPDDPFLVGVLVLAGGGYLSLRFGGDGIQRIAFSIEAGGHIALNLVVASGNAYVLVGVGMTYDTDHRDKGLQLSMFLRAGGSLNIIHLITVSVHFTLNFTYSQGDSSVTANCTVVISIDILFFHKDVSVTMQTTLQLGGGNTAMASLAAERLPNGAQSPLYVLGSHGPSADEAWALPADAPTTVHATFADVFTEQNWQEYCSAFERFD